MLCKYAIIYLYFKHRTRIHNQARNILIKIVSRVIEYNNAHESYILWFATLPPRPGTRWPRCPRHYCQCRPRIGNLSGYL